MSDVDPLTETSIQNTPFKDFGIRLCGCEKIDGALRLCQYHLGFEAAIETLRRLIPPPGKHRQPPSLSLELCGDAPCADCWTPAAAAEPGEQQ